MAANLTPRARQAMAELEADPTDVQAMHRLIIECHRAGSRPSCSKLVAAELALHFDLCFHLLDMLDESRTDAKTAASLQPDNWSSPSLAGREHLSAARGVSGGESGRKPVKPGESDEGDDDG